MTHNGKYWTVPISVFPNTEKGSILWDILEEAVEEKYFHSPPRKGGQPKAGFWGSKSD